jgi:RNA polymerase sigma factor (sigma-70 family)
MAGDEVTVWFAGLADGDDAAIEQIWQKYYDQLVRLARRKLMDANRRMADEEDIAISTFESFCRGAAAGRFPQLSDRQDLWKILVTITAAKAARQKRDAGRQKRGSGKVRGESIFGGRDDEPGRGIGNVLGSQPTPEMAFLAVEECRRLLEMLPDDTLRQVAQMKLEGYTNEEIADQMQCAPRTVERRLQKIRESWSSVMEDQDS